MLPEDALYMLLPPKMIKSNKNRLSGLLGYLCHFKKSTGSSPKRILVIPDIYASVFRYSTRKGLTIKQLIIFIGCLTLNGCFYTNNFEGTSRQRISINEGWRFYKYASNDKTDSLIYDVRPVLEIIEDDRPADARPTEAIKVEAQQEVLKPWILPTGNYFIRDTSKRYKIPDGNPGQDFPFVQINYDDHAWDLVDLPHDWAISGPFYEGWDATVGGGMGRLPSPGVAWYRKKLDIPLDKKGKRAILEIDGAMSYAMVWINGRLAGGWPYGYNSWQLDISGYIKPGEENLLAIRLDNPNHSSRWYPGGGIYRNVWLSFVEPVHVAQWGTYASCRNASDVSATVDLEVTIENKSHSRAGVEAATKIYELDKDGLKTGNTVAEFEPLTVDIHAGERTTVKGSVVIQNPRFWGPPPTQTPNLYLAVTTVRKNGETVDQFETPFGIRSLRFDPDSGIYINNEHIYIKGVNQHHDLGALGAAFNVRAAERQLEILQEMGCNAIRMAHNPPAPELLELTDRMGFLVVNEIFDSWERKKTPHDFHLIFPDWHEQDVRSFIRRDRNHPSIVMWSLGNEVGEQYTGHEGALLAKRLHEIAREEDPTRPTTVSMNYAKPDMPLPGIADAISLNYQGEGIRDAPAYAGLQGIRTSPLYPAFHKKFPGKVILSSENAAALSSRGEYLFPVDQGISAPVKDGFGGDPVRGHVSAYELYTAPFGSSADKVFASLDKHPYVAGGFVWSGWDYLGEPTPYYSARSSYFGVVDLAGFKKDRFYLYQAQWRPDLPMAHILPHWTWTGRTGEITPVHVFSSGDSAELFLNGKSLGVKTRGQYEYRFRWDSVIYEAGILKVEVYKNEKKWTTSETRTAGNPAKVDLSVDRAVIKADGKDLAFITARILDDKTTIMPTANNVLQFTISGPGEIIATDNGDPTDMTPFVWKERKAFNGYCLAIVRGIPGKHGPLRLIVRSNGLESAEIAINTR